MSESTKSKKPNKTVSRLRIFGKGCLLLVLFLGLSVVMVLASGILSGKNGDIDSMAVWSPDGDQIAFVSNREGNSNIYIMNNDGSNLRQLTSDPYAKLYLVRSPTDGYPNWSPDGEQIVFASGRDNPMWSFTELSIYIMNTDGSNPIQITNPGSVGGLGLENTPNWSPDGRHIAFVHDSRNNSDIFLMETDGSNVTQLTSYRAYTFDWSPDGKHIMFASKQNGKGDIYVMKKDGTDIVRLTNENMNVGGLSWSPNGDEVVFSSNHTGAWEIFIMNSDGSNITQLTSNQSNNQYPDWSPDNRHIVFASDRDGDWDIYVLDLDSGSLTQLTGK